ncbi:lipid A biosynthesis acyltransferase [Dyadobacter luteus]|uniref:Lipid A biosynthesis acyltransferase n=1 Tax=Dyadobacter luteus TaxID=2259619 RepID=A0A3D8YBC9_9BACT|nr:lysophospholipid acyltransferase family protein [Dyadobacter luteus]REA60708.1 lipid A biosynthesis acyltransferase [Dyadobacter luteus]
MNTFLTKILLSILTAISRLSWKSIYKLSDFFRFLIFDIVGYRKDIVISNLKASFPSYDTSSIQSIARKFYRNFTDIIFETIKLRSITRNDLLSRIDFDPQLLDDYYTKGQSLVVVAGHLGNWEMLNLFASARLHYQIVVVYHELANSTFEAWFKKVRTQFGTEMVSMKEAFNRAVAPREKPFIFILINDQSPFPEKAYWTTFLNQMTGVYRGVELIARRVNLPVLYMGVRKDDTRRGFYRFYFEKITESPKTEPNNYILQTQTELLEKDIVAQPDNWLWTHKRWKHNKPEKLQPFQLLEKTEQSDQAS